jgi:hypothetical protein
VRKKAAIDDWRLGAILRAVAMLEIRALAVNRAPTPAWPAEDYVQSIYRLANMCDNFPYEPRSRNDGKRPFAWAWKTIGSDAQQWVLLQVERYQLVWTPPE